jgi:hypothetical protein
MSGAPRISREDGRRRPSLIRTVVVTVVVSVAVLAAGYAVGLLVGRALL